MYCKLNRWMLLSLTLALCIGCGTHPEAKAAPSPAVISMVCEHGAVKSLMAASLFNREAEGRGLPFRAVSRGITLYDEVPEGIAKALEGDGFDVADFKPQELSSHDAGNSHRVIAIGVDLAAFQGHATSPILQWDDIPPASADYGAAKASLLVYIHEFLDELEKQP